MGIFDNLLRKFNLKSNSQDSEHAVIVHFQYGIDGLEPLYSLEDKLDKLITQSGVGEYDGHEIALDNSDGFLYMYGPNAEVLFKTVKPTLEKTEFMKDATATLRFGLPMDDVREINVEIK